jgi:pimeloyl-ACP methyl ester carboxylesterase
MIGANMTVAALSPRDILDRAEARATQIETPCGTGRMVWRIWGEGPPLVLLHGGYGSWRHWIHTIPHFERRYRLLVPDIPGLGDSDDAPEATPPSIAAVIAAGLDKLVRPADPIDLVGFSFGALIGSHVAVCFPRPLRSLTLVGAGALGVTRGTVVLLKAEPGMTAQELRNLSRKNLGALMIADPAKIDDLAVTIQEINVGKARVKSRRFANSASIADALRQSRPERLNAIWGANDAVAVGHFDKREALLRSIRPDVSFHLVPDAGHWVAYEAPNAFNTLLGSVLAAH